MSSVVVPTMVDHPPPARRSFRLITIANQQFQGIAERQLGPEDRTAGQMPALASLLIIALPRGLGLDDLLLRAEKSHQWKVEIICKLTLAFIACDRLLKLLD